MPAGLYQGEASAAGTPHNLVAQPTRLIGREADTAAVLDLLARDGVRLLTLTGPAGAGKTRLALQVAQEALNRFPSGVHAVDLSSVDDRSLVPGQIAAALRIGEAGDQPLFERLKAELRGRPRLLIIDNFEQVLPAATDVTALLAAVPSLTVLVTSRAALRLRWEREYPVAPLAVPPAATFAVPDELGAYPAVALFVDRAQAVRPDFALDAANAPAVAEICSRLDGLPLAIELAAARCNVFSPVELLRRLQHRLDLLESTRADVPPRQRSLRAAIDWSYQLLGPAERRVFRRHAVFSGGCTLEALGAVAHDGAPCDDAEGGSDLALLNAVSALVDNSLFVRGRAKTGETLLRMLDTIREYALAALDEAGELEEARARHADYFLTRAEHGNAQIMEHDGDDWQEWLEADMDNVRAAAAFYAASPARAEHGLRLATALLHVFTRRGLLSEGRAWLDRAIGAVPLDARVDQAVLGRALAAAGHIAEHQGDYAAARQRFEESATLLRQAGDRSSLASTLCWMALTATDDGAAGSAQATLEESLAIFRELGDRSGEARVLNCLGERARLAGDYEMAARYYEESLAIVQALGSDAEIKGAEALHNLGYVETRRGQPRAALALFDRALALYEQRDYRRMQAVCIGALAGAALAARPEASVRLLSASAALLSALGTSIQPPDRAEYARSFDEARQLLDDESFQAAWDAGARLTIEGATQLAHELATASLASSERPGHGQPSDERGLLSPRELEVAALIARGYTNRQIAEKLVIAPRTADTHVSNILAKLGFTTRAQVASWAAQLAAQAAQA